MEVDVKNRQGAWKYTRAPQKLVKQKMVAAVSIVRGLIPKDRPDSVGGFELSIGGFDSIEKEPHEDLEKWKDDDKFDEEMEYMQQDLQVTAIYCDTYKRNRGGLHTARPHL